MQTSHQQAYQNLIKSKNRSKQYYDEGTRTLKLHVGNKVLHLTRLYAVAGRAN